MDLQKSLSTASLLEFNDSGSSTDEDQMSEEDVENDYGSRVSSRSASRNRSKSPLRRTRYSFLISILRWPVFVSL